MENFGEDLLHVGIGLVVVLLIMLVGAFVFSKLTRFNDSDEITKGNEAAGMYMGSKLLGLCIIVAMVSYSSDSWTEMLAWSGIGIVLLSIVYIIFEVLTPKFNVNDEIAKGNVAVAQLLRSIILGAAVVIGTILM